MRYALSSRQSSEALRNCDEIIVAENDHDYIFTLIDKYPDKTIVLRCNNLQHSVLDINKIKNYNIVTKENFKVATDSLYTLQQIIKEGIKAFSIAPISTYYELRSLEELDVCEVMLGPPIFFDIKNVKRQTSLPIRAVPNKANQLVYPHSTGVSGCWIRPEDVEIYEEYIDTMQFYFTTLQQEETLFKIYHTQKTWPGNLNILVPDLNFTGSNRYIRDHMERRLSCKQKCEENPRACQYCQLILTMAQPKQIKEYKESLQND